MAPEVSESVPSGERVERARRLRRYLTQAVSAVLGMSLGALLVMRMHDDLGALPPAAAVGLAAAYVALIAVVSVIHHRLTDEFEIRETHQAAIGGVYVYMIGYPAWWILWLGNLAPEPDHEILFLSFCIGVTVSFLYHRFR